MMAKQSKGIQDSITVFVSFILPATLISLGVIPFDYRFTILILASIFLVTYIRITSIEIKDLGLAPHNTSTAIRAILPLTILLSIPMIIYFAAYGQRIDNSHVPWYFYIFAILISSPLQEFLYRGYLFHFFSAKGFGRWKRIVLSSLLYSYVHAIYHDVPTLVMTFVLGILWGLHYEKFRNLWSVSLSHAVLGFVAIATGII